MRAEEWEWNWEAGGGSRNRRVAGLGRSGASRGRERSVENGGVSDDRLMRVGVLHLRIVGEFGLSQGGRRVGMTGQGRLRCGYAGEVAERLKAAVC